jgi:hypothetical protein
MKIFQRCNAKFGVCVCERELGHRGKHLENCSSWSNSGAARVENEQELANGVGVKPA